MRFNQLGMRVVAAALFAVPSLAQAQTIDFGIDLSVLGPTQTVGTTTYDFTSVTTPIGFLGGNGTNSISISGASFVEQTLVGGSPNNQPFVDSGYLQFGANAVGNNVLDDTGSPASRFGTNDAHPTGTNFLYFEFIDLTGTVSADGSSLTFDTGPAQTGKIRLILDDDDGVTVPNDQGGGAQTPTYSGADDGTGTITDTTALVIAEFDLIPASGGSGLAFNGGAFVSGTINVTLSEQSPFNFPGLFVDDLGNPLDSSFLIEFIDANATAFGVDLTDPNLGLFNITNNASLSIAQVPEPSTLGISAVGLLGLGLLARRRRKAAKYA